jgi:hypothetical protein
MYKVIFLLCFIFSLPFGLRAQDTNLPEFDIKQWEVESKLRFLASDELEGRRAGDRGNDIAARFIADHFQALGLKPGASPDSYFQEFALIEQTLPSDFQLILEKDMAISPENLMVLSGKQMDVSSSLVFAEYGWINEETGQNDYAELDVSGKIVLSLVGTPESSYMGMREMYSIAKKKGEIAREHGAIGLIEITQFRLPFSSLKRYLKSSTTLKDDSEDSDFLYVWSSTDAFSVALLDQIKQSEKGMDIKFKTSGMIQNEMITKNVIGILEGTDPELKDEYIMLSAHFDHVGAGVKANASRNYVNNDSIYNGARDNAIGTTAMLIAAQTLAQNPPKRSVAFIAWNAEEMGLLGSQYYAANPTIPLHQFVYNLNVDGPGYNSTEHVSITGYDKTNVDGLLVQAITAFGLGITENPAPEQRGYYRSDNITFAKLGIPAIAIHQGVLQHDAEIKKYYHQANDDADSVDMPYAHKFCQIYSYAARLIADMEATPYWVPGDEFEEAAKKLYQEE